MYQIHGLSISSNTTKTVYVAEALGIDYDYIPMNLAKSEHKTPEHFKRHPLGKLPTLTHNNETLFESNAICCYLANVENSQLYPSDNKLYRARIDQWLAFFTNHLGRWLNNYAFEKVAKEKFGLGEPNKELEKEAHYFILEQLPCVNEQLSQNRYFLGTQLSIADYVAFAYFENAEMAELSLNDFPAVAAWYRALKSSDVIQRSHEKLGRGRL